MSKDRTKLAKPKDGFAIVEDGADGVTRFVNCNVGGQHPMPRIYRDKDEAEAARQTYGGDGLRVVRVTLRQTHWQ